MRKVKIINIEGRGEVTVKEVSPLAVYQAWQEQERVKALEALAIDAVAPSFAEIKGWYPSELEAVLSAFMEVNNSFFAIARLIKMDGLVAELIQAMSKNLPVAFADSFSRAMLTPGIMDGPIS